MPREYKHVCGCSGFGRGITDCCPACCFSVCRRLGASEDMAALLVEKAETEMALHERLGSREQDERDLADIVARISDLEKAESVERNELKRLRAKYE